MRREEGDNKPIRTSPVVVAKDHKDGSVRLAQEICSVLVFGSEAGQKVGSVPRVAEISHVNHKLSIGW